jgi:hypothetical protein
VGGGRASGTGTGAGGRERTRTRQRANAPPRCVGASTDALGRAPDGRSSRELPALRARFMACFPSLEGASDGSGGSGGSGGSASIAALPIAVVWERGLALLTKPVKSAADWKDARRLCERAALAHPEVFWYQLCAGICCAYPPKARAADAHAGLHYARAALAVACTDPANGPPLAHALVARCLVNCGGGRAEQADEARAAVAAVVLNPGSNANQHVEGSEHAWLLLDSMRVMRQLCKVRPESARSEVALAKPTPLTSHLNAFIRAFPGLSVPAARIAEESDGCAIA